MTGAGLEAGQIFVDFVPRLKEGFGKKIEADAAGPLARIGGLAKGAGLAVGVGLAAAVPAVAAVGLKIGATFDDAYDTIRLGTGKTGKELEGLKTSFRNVLRDVPDDAGKVSGALAEVAKRTGLTGKPLETMTKKLLTLSRLTGTDVNENVRASTRLFSQWGVAIDDQGPALDRLFRISQKTGIGVGELQDGLTKYGPALKSLGFGLDESSALLGQFEKAGINTGPVLAAMRKGLATFAKAGESPAKAFARVTSEIKNAGSEAEANQIALKVFGAKAGPELAANIRKGAFGVGDLVKKIQSGGDTIEGAAADTDDWAEKWGKVKNRILLAAEPLAGKIFDAVNALMDRAAPLVDELGKRLPGAIEKIREVAEPVFGWLKQVFGILFRGDFTGGGPLAEDSPFVSNLFKFRDFVIEKIVPVVKELLAWLGDHWKPVLIGAGIVVAALVAPLATVAAAIVYAYAKSETFRNVVQAVASWISGTLIPVLSSFASVVIEKFGQVVAWVRQNWPAIQEAIGHVVNAIVAIVSFAVDWIQKYWAQFGDRILENVRRVWSIIAAVVKVAIDLVRGIIETVVALINGDWGKAWDAIRTTFSRVWGGILGIVKNVLGILRNSIGGALEAAGGLVERGLGKIVDFFSKLPGKLARAAGDVFGWLWQAFQSAVNKIIRGWNALDFKIPGFDPPGPGPKFSGFTLGLPDIPELWKGGRAIRPGLSLIGERGPELLSLPTGATVLPLDSFDLARAAGDGKLFETLAVDARGIEDPLAVADYTSRVLSFRTRRKVKR